MDIAVLIPIFGIILSMIPVAGLTLVLTIRLAVKPLVETLAEALRESRQGAGTDVLASHLGALSEEVETLTHEVRELRSAQDFDRTLLGHETGPDPRNPDS